LGLGGEILALAFLESPGKFDSDGAAKHGMTLLVTANAPALGIGGVMGLGWVRVSAQSTANPLARGRGVPGHTLHEEGLAHLAKLAPGVEQRFGPKDDVGFGDLDSSLQNLIPCLASPQAHHHSLAWLALVQPPLYGFKVITEGVLEILQRNF
jgi:hypothetical protein